MKKIILAFFIVCNLLVGCGKVYSDGVEKDVEKSVEKDSQLSLEESVKKAEQQLKDKKSEKKEKIKTTQLSQEIELSEKNVRERLSLIPTIIDVKTADIDEKKGNTDTLDECSVLAYFASDLIDQSQFDEKGTIEKGTACGGSVEIFKTKEAAKKRDEYLNGTMISMLSPGEHIVQDNIVVRISKDMPYQQRIDFEKLIFIALTTTNEDELNEIKNYSFDGGHSAEQSESILDEKLEKDKVNMPASYYEYEASNDYKEVVDKLQASGFENVQTSAIYDLDIDIWGESDLNEVQSVSIDGKTEFSKGDLFPKTAEVIVTYHAYEKDNPNINFTPYTASDLLQEFDKNSLRAEKTYTGEYAQITGVIAEIRDDFILLTDTEWRNPFDMVCCKAITDEQKEQILQLNKGDTISIRGKIEGVDMVYAYYVYVYYFN